MNMSAFIRELIDIVDIPMYIPNQVGAYEQEVNK